MNLKGIVNITGKPGLFRIMSMSKNNFVVESLDGTGKRFSLPTSSKVASLEEISIYTIEDNVPLWKVLKDLHEIAVTTEIPSEKSADAIIREFFSEVVPDFDKDKVYVSDMKKLIKWYKILSDKLDFDSLGKEVEKGETETTTNA